MASSPPILCSAVLPDTEIPLLLSKLHGLLPRPLPLFRRLQFHLRHPNPPHAQAFVAVAASAGSDDDGKQSLGSGLIPGPADAQSEPATDLDSILEWLRTGPSGQQPSTVGGNVVVDDNDKEEGRPWLAAHIDLSNAGQTQVWVFASWEEWLNPFGLVGEDETSNSGSSVTATSTASTTAVTTPSTTTGDNPQTSSQNPLHQALFHALLSHLRTNLIPSLPISPPIPWLSLRDSGKLLSQPYLRSKVIFGTVNKSLWPLFPANAITRTDLDYAKFLIPLPEEKEEETEDSAKSSSSSSNLERGSETGVESPAATATAAADAKAGELFLPPGLSFGPLLLTHFNTVVSRTKIPRTSKTLSELANIGLFSTTSSPTSPSAPPTQDPTTSPSPASSAENPELIGWAFLGKDASLTSLHTEPSFRGRGLAVALARQLWSSRHRLAFPAFPEGEEEIMRGMDGGREMAEGGRRSRKEESRRRKSEWAHADVSLSNEGSARVMIKLGGRVGWKGAWIEMDLDRVGVID